MRILNEEELRAAYGGRTALVTGASGFIGAWVAEGLARRGAQVVLAGRNAGLLAQVADSYGFTGRVEVADFSEAGGFRRLFDKVQPDITFNLAGYGVDPGERDGRQAERINVKLVEEIAATIAAGRASDWPGQQLVHAGSGAEYGAVDGPVSEDLPAKPVSLYGRTKLAGSQILSAAAEQKKLRALTARLFLVYGPGEHPSRLLPSLIAAAHSRKPLPMTAGEQLRDFTYVGEVAEGLARLGCVRGMAPTVVNLATGQQTRLRDFVTCAGTLLGMSASQLQFGALPYRGDETRQGPVITQRLEELTGWKPHCMVQEGLRQSIALATQRSGVRV